MTSPYEPTEDERRVIAWLRKEAEQIVAPNMVFSDKRMLNADYRAGFIEGAFVVADEIEQGHHLHD